VPHRGKTNQPAWVAWVAQQVADIKNLPIEAVAQATSHNFERLFSQTLDHEIL
jgi:TatD DNase family protein